MENFILTNLRMPEIKASLYTTLEAIMKSQDFKSNKSHFRFNRKRGKSSDEIFFLFYNYFPLNYSFSFFFTPFNKEIEDIKISFPTPKFYSAFHRYSLFINPSDFTNHINQNAWKETGYHYTVSTQDELIAVNNAIYKTFKEEVLPLSNELKTVSGIDEFFIKKTSVWSENTGSMNNMIAELTAAKLNDKRDYHLVYKELCEHITSSKRPYDVTLKVVQDFYEFLKQI